MNSLRKMLQKLENFYFLFFDTFTLLLGCLPVGDSLDSLILLSHFQLIFTLKCKNVGDHFWQIVRLLANHPHFGISLMTADRKAGQSIGSVFPHLVSQV